MSLHHLVGDRAMHAAPELLNRFHAADPVGRCRHDDRRDDILSTFLAATLHRI
jgi:hypothetical protein